MINEERGKKGRSCEFKYDKKYLIPTNKLLKSFNFLSFGPDSVHPTTLPTQIRNNL